MLEEGELSLGTHIEVDRSPGQVCIQSLADYDVGVGVGV